MNGYIMIISSMVAMATMANGYYVEYGACQSTLTRNQSLSCVDNDGNPSSNCIIHWSSCPSSQLVVVNHALVEADICTMHYWHWECTPGSVATIPVDIHNDDDNDGDCGYTAFDKRNGFLWLAVAEVIVLGASLVTLCLWRAFGRKAQLSVTPVY
jgi:hypothetical protein